ncbi:MAG: XrtA-associated tyrosine autokinase [Nitrospirota bacterium]
MSKIEKALEKAVEARELGPGAPPQPAESRNGAGQHTFVSGPEVIDAALVDPHVVCITDPFSANAEQYKRLRARLIRDTAKDFRNIIMVASTTGGEGKSLTAINLALALAQEIDHTVLLVDADLRMPSVHTYLGLNPRCGLSDYLSGKAELQDVLVRTGIGKLVLLPAGEPPENPAELLSSGRMKELVKEMKHRYKDRYIIFDTSPVLITADALSLSRHMDGVVFVVHADRTHQKDVARALALIRGTPVLGVVLNDIPGYLARTADSYYRYRYGDQKRSAAVGQQPEEKQKP